MSTLSEVRRILARLSGIDDFPDDIRLGAGICGTGDGTLGLDSLDKLEAVMEFEEVFGIEISDADASTAAMGTPVGIAAYIDRRLLSVSRP